MRVDLPVHFADNSVAILVNIILENRNFCKFFLSTACYYKIDACKNDSYIAFADTDIDLLHNFSISAYSNLIIFLEFFSL